MVAAAIVGGAVIGTVGANMAAKKGSDAAGAATDVQNQQYWQTRADQEPWRQAGIGALDQINAGMGEGGDFNRSFTLSDFQKDPGYDFRLNQGLDAVQGSRAARGSMMSGATLKALSDYGSNYASSEFGKAYDRFNNDRTQRFNRLATVAGIGQTATNNVGTAGANMANANSNAAISAGNAGAAGVMGTTNAITGGLSNLQSLYYFNQMNGGNGSTPGGNPSGYYEGSATGPVYVP